MFRRRPAARVTAATAPGPASTVAPEDLAAGGWVLPKGVVAAHEGSEPAWTLVGTVSSPTATPVDPAGLVVGEGWSLDWWLGADDRWHHPAREAAVRQSLLADAPIVETLVRIPGGDAIHRAYGIRSARGTGDEWVVVEVENQTPVPLGVAMVIRPFMADAIGSVGSITVEPVEGGAGRDVAHLVRVDGRPAVILPRRPSVVAAGSAAVGDAVDAVADASILASGDPIPEASCPDGLATLALVVPLAHTATFRAVLPVGELDRKEAIAYPSVVPDAATVASGWEVHRRGPRFELPEPRLQAGVERARAQLLLAHDGDAVHRDGARAADIEPGATEVILGALDLLDRTTDVGLVITPWTDRLADPDVAVDAIVLDVVSRHWQLHRIDALLDWMLPEVAAAVERIDRADKRGRLTDPVVRGRAICALGAGSDLLAASGQAEAAKAVVLLTERMQASHAPTAIGPNAADQLVDIAHRLAAGDRSALDDLDAQLAAASPSTAWTGPGRGTRRIGHDLAAAAALVAVGRSLLVAERPDGLALIPVFPERWYGGGVELHDAPTAFGTISFGIRWHGSRPALLWDLEPHEGIGPVVLTVPGLDPSWSTTELKGDALLAEVAPPAGIDLVREVAEHPGLQEHMRPEADDPDSAPPPIPEGGTFS